MSFFEQQEQRMNKQFISILDSAYFVSEHGKGTLQQAFDLIVGSLLRQQTYLLLITPTSVKAVYVCSSNEHSQYEPFITFESIAYELKACLDCGNIGIGNPIYKLGFAKKRFVEQLVNIGMQLDEQIIFDTESPDITHAEHDNDSDELAFYQGLPKEYDTLRAENEKIKAQYQDLWNKKELPEAFFNIQKKLYEDDRQRLNECKDKLDRLSVDYKYLESQHDYYKRNYESKKKSTALIQQIAEKRISELESQLAQAKTELAAKPADSITQSNTDIHNIKKEAIKQFNRSLATVLIELDYKGKLRKGDIANYIVPYMKELAFVLADEQQDKANNLTVTYDTLYDNHLKNLGFKQGRQSDDEKQKVNIDLLFKKQLPITE